MTSGPGYCVGGIPYGSPDMQVYATDTAEAAPADAYESDPVTAKSREGK